MAFASFLFLFTDSTRLMFHLKNWMLLHTVINNLMEAQPPAIIQMSLRSMAED
jgi:hypothetical protein